MGDVLVRKNTKEAKLKETWCVYLHTNKINGKKYVGITSQKPERRWNNGNGYKDSPRFWNAIQKYGWDNFKHEVLLTRETYDYACQAEKCLIRHYKTRNPAYGYNLTAGGDGIFGYKCTEEELKQRSARNSGPNNPFYGRAHTEEAKIKIGIASSNRTHTEESKRKMSINTSGERHPLYGKYRSDETKKKISDSRKGKYCGENNPNYGNHKLAKWNHPNAKAVYCIEFDELFWGAKEAENLYQVNRFSISECCRGKRKFAGLHPVTGEHLHWLYVEDEMTKNGMIINGAISLGYVSKQQLEDYLSALKNY